MESLEQVIDACVRLYLDLDPRCASQFVVKPVRVYGNGVKTEWSTEIGAYACYGDTVIEAAESLRIKLVHEAQGRISRLRKYL